VTTAERRESIRKAFTHHLGPGEAAHHPLHALLCEEGSKGGPLVDLLLDTPELQARPVLLFAVLHHMALSDPTGPLRDCFPSVAWFEERLMSADSPGADPPAASPPDPAALNVILDFCADRSTEIVRELAVRRTQTNEVGRSALLLAAIGEATQGRRCALVDLGASAGLNLVPDRYRYARSDGSTSGDPTSPVRIDVEILGHPIPSAPVDIDARIGIDLDPPDANNDDAVRWLLACQWPDDLPRFERTRRALGMRRSDPAAPLVHRGDVIDLLPGLIDEIPEETMVVVTNSWVVTYMDLEAQSSLAQTIRSAASRRPVAWISFELPKLVPGISPPRIEADRIRGASVLTLETEPGLPRVLAQAHPHGTWVSWEA
jgi:hypothetical protein